MNRPEVRRALGARPDLEFKMISPEVSKAYWDSGGFEYAAGLLPPLVDAGVRLLVYAGAAGEYGTLRA